MIDSLGKIETMKYDRYEEVESTSWGEECPHYISIRVSFKSKSDRDKFKRETKKILVSV